MIGVLVFINMQIAGLDLPALKDAFLLQICYDLYFFRFFCVFTLLHRSFCSHNVVTVGFCNNIFNLSHFLFWISMCCYQTHDCCLSLWRIMCCRQESGGVEKGMIHLHCVCWIQYNSLSASAYAEFISFVVYMWRVFFSVFCNFYISFFCQFSLLMLLEMHFFDSFYVILSEKNTGFHIFWLFALFYILKFSMSLLLFWTFRYRCVAPRLVCLCLSSMVSQFVACYVMLSRRWGWHLLCSMHLPASFSYHLTLGNCVSILSPSNCCFYFKHTHTHTHTCTLL